MRGPLPCLPCVSRPPSKGAGLRLSHVPLHKQHRAAGMQHGRAARGMAHLHMRVEVSLWEPVAVVEGLLQQDADLQQGLPDLQLPLHSLPLSSVRQPPVQAQFQRCRVPSCLWAPQTVDKCRCMALRPSMCRGRERVSVGRAAAGGAAAGAVCPDGGASWQA